MKKTKKIKNIERLFIANRGEVACRIIRACKARSITSIVGFSSADRNSEAVRTADERIHLGAAEARESYAHLERVIAAATHTRADALHPGYGFLSERAALSAACSKAGIVFIGPKAKPMRILGDKISAKERASALSIPLLKGVSISPTELDHFGRSSSFKHFLRQARFPLLIKASAGGGGRGMRIVHSADKLHELAQSASREAHSFFGDGAIFIEPFVSGARHVEVQVLASADGETRSVGTRDCSLQRRYQKIIEEAPAPSLSAQCTRALMRASEKLVAGIGYVGLATVEFLVGKDEAFYFLEVNTRLQVEHPVTEMTLGIDLVQIQLQLAEGGSLKDILPGPLTVCGHAIEARLCAERAERNFEAATGQITYMCLPSTDGVRIDTGYAEHDVIPYHYDSLVAKIICSAPTRQQTINKLLDALSSFHLAPLGNNRNALVSLLKTPSVIDDSHGLQTADAILEEYQALYQERCNRVAMASALFSVYRTSSSGLPAWDKHHPEMYRTLVPHRSYVMIDHEVYSVHALNSNPHCWEITLTLQDGSCIRAVLNSVFCVNKRLDFTLNGSHYSFMSEQLERDIRIVTHDALVYTVVSSPPPKLNRSTQSNAVSSGQVMSHLPGRIIKISAREGTFVAEGQELFVIESMKMEHVISSSCAGTVGAWRHQIGESIAKGEHIVTIEPSSS